MFRPNKTCRIQLSSGNDVYGQPLPVTYVTERCAVVKISVKNEKSSVRADSSASRGNAMEFETESTLLMTANSKVKIDDIIEVMGFRLKVTGKLPRVNLEGGIDHYQISATVWSNP